MNQRPASEVQRQYYAETADRYDSMHVHAGDEHHFALSVMLAAVDFCAIESVLDIGSGTGRAIAHVKRHRPTLRVKGVEPVWSGIWFSIAAREAALSGKVVK